MSKSMFVDPEKAFSHIEKEWLEWDKSVGSPRYVIGISGGVDSTCVAALACRVLGKERVVGVSLPCDGQRDMADVDKVFSWLGIKRVTIDIGDAFNSIVNGIENNAVDITHACLTNMPARLRMTALFGVAQCVNGMVLNTCNLSEDIVGYSTFGGDNFGCYAPIRNLTKTEVKSLTSWLGAEDSLAFKTPVDGLQPLTDEESLGFTYESLDKLVRGGEGTDAFKEVVHKKYLANKFKLEIVDIPGPSFSFLPDYVRAFWG